MWCGCRRGRGQMANAIAEADHTDARGVLRKLEHRDVGGGHVAGRVKLSSHKQLTGGRHVLDLIDEALIKKVVLGHAIGRPADTCHPV